LDLKEHGFETIAILAPLAVRDFFSRALVSAGADMTKLCDVGRAYCVA
jgi:hypothetical protein